jgi:hypothetical protein
MHRKQHFLYFKYIDHTNIKITFLFLVFLTNAPGAVVSIFHKIMGGVIFVDLNLRFYVSIIAADFYCLSCYRQSDHNFIT